MPGVLGAAGGSSDLKRVLLALAIISTLVVAAVFFWWTTFPRGNAGFRWIPVTIDGVKSIHVHGPAGTYELRDGDSGWQALISGNAWKVSIKALPERVADFVSTLSGMMPRGAMDRYDVADAARYGLADPTVKVIVIKDAVGKKEYVVKLSSADNRGVVYGWNSRSPHVLYEFGPDALRRLAQPASHFFDTRVFGLKAEDVSKVQLRQPFGSSWLVEREKDGFHFALPGYLKGKPASDSALKLYLHTLTTLKAGRPLFEPVETDPVASLTLRLWTKGEEPVQAEFFAVSGDSKYYVGKSSLQPVPFRLDAQTLAELTKSAFDMQGRSVLKLDLGKVQHVNVAHGSRTFSAERTESGWRETETKKELPGIDMALWRFTELQFEALPLNNLPDSATWLMDCRLLGAGGDALADLVFFVDPKLPQGQCWLQNGGGMYYPVSSRLLKDLQGLFPAKSEGRE